MKWPSRQTFHLRDIAAVGGVAALFLVFGSSVGMRGLGCLIVLRVLIGWKSARIPYGWEGHEPTGYITGVLARTLLGLGGLIGAWMVWEPDLWLAIFGWADP